MYIFDLDGTITDSNGLWGEIDVEFLARRGLTVTPEYQEVVGRAIFPIAADYTKEYYHLEDDPQDIMAEWEELAAHHYRDLVPLKEGAEAFLRRCKVEGKPIALFSACRPNLCRMALDRFDLTTLFDHLIFAEEIGFDKHDPRCFTQLSARLGVRPEECVLIDDSPFNCATAKSAGMETIGVYDDFYAHRQEELKAICTQYIHSFKELL